MFHSNSNKPKKVGVMSTYLPRHCGIGTFTFDFIQAFKNIVKNCEINVLAMNDNGQGYQYNHDVNLEILDINDKDYKVAADYLNMNMYDALLVQHEFGIYGGEAGEKLLKIVKNVRMPVIITLHTILENPLPHYDRVFRELIEYADKLVVMSKKACEILQRVYQTKLDKICLIPHGIPDLAFIDPSYYKDKFEVVGKNMLLTFGLLSPNKGIEYMLEAMPKVIKKHPNTVYYVLGSLHPNEIKMRGKSYLKMLKDMVKKNGLQKHVRFVEGFVSLDKLCEYIGAADVYVIPYLNKEQITSGTLSYAMGAAKPIVATPFWHAEESLANGRGLMAKFRDAQSLAKNVNYLLANEKERTIIRKRAYEYSRKMVWSEVAKEYYNLFVDLLSQRRTKLRNIKAEAKVFQHNYPIPDINLAHMLKLTDCTGILEHAKYGVINYRHGYCTDDNARALITALLYYKQTNDSDILPYIDRYLAFLYFAFNQKEKIFLNRLAYNRVWQDKIFSEAAHARALWALGKGCAIGPDAIKDLCVQLFNDAVPSVKKCQDMHALAYAIMGINCYLKYFGKDSVYKLLMRDLAFRLYDNFVCNESNNWYWCSDIVTWGSALIPRALIIAGSYLSNEDFVQKGLEVLRWLIDIQTEENVFCFVGNNNWYKKGQEKAIFDQQPIEAMAMTIACVEAYEKTDEQYWLTQAQKGLEWFLGRNLLHAPLYDEKTGGCRDGLGPNWINANQGSESVLAWLISLLEFKRISKQNINSLKLFEEIDVLV
jgi:glycosyltransferase involved in cell wall biosynthesis